MEYGVALNSFFFQLVYKEYLCRLFPADMCMQVYMSWRLYQCTQVPMHCICKCQYVCVCKWILIWLYVCDFVVCRRA